MPSEPAVVQPASTGVEGLDDVLGGGLTPNRLYLLEGMPGAGKTTLAFQFLMEGARRGEPVFLPCDARGGDPGQLLRAHPRQPERLHALDAE